MSKGKFLKCPNSVEEYFKILSNYEYFFKEYTIVVIEEIILSEKDFEKFCGNFNVIEELYQINNKITFVNDDLAAYCYRVTNNSSNIEVYFFTSGYLNPRYISISRIS